MATPQAITLDHVSKAYKGTRVVDDASFSVPRGRITALLGPNGAGKTTVLNMILGLSTPTSGHVVHHDEGRPRLGASLDGGWFCGSIPASRDWDYAAALCGATARHSEEVRRFVGLPDEAMGRSVAKFSTGMRQRHGIGIALLSRPDVLVLDEPVNGLDPEGIRWLRSVLARFAEQGGTVLLSSHLLGEVAHVADHLVVLKRTVRFAGPVAALDPATGDLESQYFDLVGEGASSCLS